MSTCVVITGGGGALGSELARTLLARGDRVALVDSPRAAEHLKTLAATLGPQALAVTADVTSSAAWRDALVAIEAAFGPPTHAALIAGAYRGGKPFHEQDDAVWSAMLQANLETARQSLRALLPGMVTRKQGSIVLIGSRPAERPWDGAGSVEYTVAKSAVVALAKAVAAEVGKHGVRVNSVLPSTMDTPANRAAMPGVDPSGWVALSSAAQVIAFLLSDAARDVSGAALPIYGRE